MGLKPLPVPDTMTGGVDLTGVADLTGNGDTLDRLNKQPEVINTLTGGHDQGMIPNVNMPADPITENAPPGKDVTRGLEEVARAYDGVPVRVRPASRFRTMRLLIAPGSIGQLAMADSRRTSLTILVTGNTGDTCYVGPDQATANTSGFPLIAGTGPVALVMTHGDQVAFATPSTNTANVTVSLAWEVQE